jgi:hypothetical protein
MLDIMIAVEAKRHLLRHHTTATARHLVNAASSKIRFRKEYWFDSDRTTLQVFKLGVARS